MRGISIDNLAMFFSYPKFTALLKNNDLLVSNIIELINGKDTVKQIGFGILLMRIGFYSEAE